MPSWRRVLWLPTIAVALGMFLALLAIFHLPAFAQGSPCADDVAKFCKVSYQIRINRRCHPEGREGSVVSDSARLRSTQHDRRQLITRIWYQRQMKAEHAMPESASDGTLIPSLPCPLQGPPLPSLPPSHLINNASTIGRAH
jgi:hypothetical protein